MVYGNRLPPFIMITQKYKPVNMTVIQSYLFYAITGNITKQY